MSDDSVIELDDLVGRVLAAMPDDEPMATKMTVLVAAVLKASGLPGDEAMCALAAMVGVFHDGVEASIVVGLPGDTPDERLVMIYDSDGKVRQQHVVGSTVH